MAIYGLEIRLYFGSVLGFGIFLWAPSMAPTFQVDLKYGPLFRMWLMMVLSGSLLLLMTMSG